MSDVVIVALVGAGGSLLGSLFGILASNKLTAYRLEQLEKKVDKHNSVVDRTYKLERDVATLKQHDDEHNRIVDRTYKLERDVAMLKQHVDDVHKNDE